MASRITSSGATRVTSTGADRVTSTLELVESVLPLRRDLARSFADVRLEVTEDGPDLVLEKNDLAIEKGLATATLVSLFSDGRAPQDADLPDGGTRRGWWAGDAADPFGSLLWLVLDRAKITTAVLERIRSYAETALQWLIREGIAERADVVVSRTGQEQVALEVNLLRGRARRWPGLWEGTDADPRFISGLRVQILTL